MGIFEKRCILKNTTRENMIERITLACHSISRNVLLSTVDSFERRIQLWIIMDKYLNTY